MPPLTCSPASVENFSSSKLSANCEIESIARTFTGAKNGPVNPLSLDHCTHEDNLGLGRKKHRCAPYHPTRHSGDQETHTHAHALSLGVAAPRSTFGRQRACTRDIHARQPTPHRSRRTSRFCASQCDVHTCPVHHLAARLGRLRYTPANRQMSAALPSVHIGRHQDMRSLSPHRTVPHLDQATSSTRSSLASPLPQH